MVLGLGLGSLTSLMRVLCPEMGPERGDSLRRRGDKKEEGRRSLEGKGTAEEMERVAWHVGLG